MACSALWIFVFFYCDPLHVWVFHLRLSARSLPVQPPQSFVEHRFLFSVFFFRLAQRSHCGLLSSPPRYVTQNPLPPAREPLVIVARVPMAPLSRSSSISESPDVPEFQQRLPVRCFIDWGILSHPAFMRPADLVRSSVLSLCACPLIIRWVVLEFLLQILCYDGELFLALS